ncbi:fibronectin type III domain-containing protein [Streptomyces sp. NPDC008222]|uniref:fibronectin type III domain-containing protein n=1 Tax=Streptomyces sp. NPDC008222 TaxID=3364820 RepID=UPI0036E7F354
MRSIGRSRLAAATAAVVAMTGGLVAVTSSPASAANCTANTYTRQFFSNTSFSGAPKRTDCDTAVSENWGTNSPGVSGVAKDNFGVRWQVTRNFGSGGPFAFTASGQDGIHVYLDGVRKIDLWKNGSSTVSRTVDLTIPRGTHTLRLDYVNWTGAAAVKFAYTPRTGATVDHVAPLTPTAAKVVYDKDTNSAAFSWAPNKEMDLAYYRVYRQTAVGDWAPVVLTAKTTWTDTGLRRDGKPIRYYIAVTDRAGNLSQSTPVLTVYPIDTVAPTAPVIVVSHMANTPSSLKINWDARTEEEMRNGGTIGIYRSTGDTLGGSPELIATTSMASSPTSVYVYVDELPAFDGTTYTYAAKVTDAAGNQSPMSAPDSVTPDSVPPAPLTGLTATPRADGVLLSWDAPAESGLSYSATRVVRRPDGSTAYDSDGCHDAVDPTKPTALPNAMLCAGPADGETVTFLVVAVDEWANHIALDQAPTVTSTELDGRPDDARGEDSGALTVRNTANMAGTGGPLEWSCSDEAACAGITEYRVERWNATTRTYERVTSVAAAPNRLFHAYVSMPLGQTSYFRITGVLADGTPAAVVHASAARGAFV